MIARSILSILIASHSLNKELCVELLSLDHWELGRRAEKVGDCV